MMVFKAGAANSQAMKDTGKVEASMRAVPAAAKDALRATFHRALFRKDADANLFPEAGAAGLDTFRDIKCFVPRAQCPISRGLRGCSRPPHQHRRAS
eukprot:6109874-Alexandrium_andersonii.AAC.1